MFILIFRMIPFVYIVLKEYRPLNFTVSKFAIVVIIVIGLLMGYSRTFYGETPNLVCEDNVIKTHERVAEQLNEIIPSDSLVYWHLSSNMLLLYLPQAEIFPPLLNTNFNYVHRTQPEDSDLLYRFGYWDQYLKQEWLNEADFLLIAGQLEEDWLNLIDSGRYQLMGVTDPYESCRPEITTINVLKNMRKE